MGLTGPQFTPVRVPLVGGPSLASRCMSHNAAPLAGLRLVEVSMLGPGALTTNLADLRADVIKGVPLHARRFDFEPEVTAKMLKRRLHIYEVPISFDPRHQWRDGSTHGCYRP